MKKNLPRITHGMNNFPRNNNNTQTPKNPIGETYHSTHTRFFKAFFLKTLVQIYCNHNMMKDYLVPF